MSAPAAIAISKLNYPETEQTVFIKEEDVNLQKRYCNVVYVHVELKPFTLHSLFYIAIVPVNKLFIVHLRVIHYKCSRKIYIDLKSQDYEHEY